MTGFGVEHLTVRYGPLVALADATVPVDPGSVAAVVGGDGAGKTTCLKALVGLVRPAGGGVRRPAKERIGYVPATAGIYPDLTVAENLSFSARSYRMSAAVLAERIEELSGRLGLAQAADRLGAQLSGGMQRKLAVGMALVHRPDLLVLDEPTTGVDPVSRAELWRLIAGAASEGAAVLVATTYMNEAVRARFVALFESGSVLSHGAPEDVVAGVPGVVATMPQAPPGPHSWRRGAGWRTWSPSGRLPEGAVAVVPDLEDAAVVATLAAEQGERP